MRTRTRIAAATATALTVLAALTGAANATAPTHAAPGCRPGVAVELLTDGTWRTCQTTPAATPAPSVTATASPTPTSIPSPTPTSSSAPTSSRPATTIRAYITGYSWWDNTPPGSAAISHPQIHQTASGTGTYTDPITVAVGHTITSGRSVLDWPAGTRVYIPNLRRYGIVEDTCGDGPRPQDGPCHTGYPTGASTWLDLWVGGKGSNSAAADRCMASITRVSTVVPDPPAGYPVVAGEIANACTTYGDQIPAVVA